MTAKIDGSEAWPRAIGSARVEVNNDEGYKPYAAANPAIFKKFGGKFVVRGGKYECPEGQSRSRNVVIEFPDYADAQWPATARRNTRPTSRSASRTRSPISSSSRVTTARSRRAIEGVFMRAILSVLPRCCSRSAASAQSATPEQKAQLAPTGALRAAIVTIPFLAKQDARRTDQAACAPTSPPIWRGARRALRGRPRSNRRTTASRRSATATPM